jgi:hypothetical protein
MRPGWHKFAILGSTYARALQNAARRAGQAAPAAAYAGIAAQPLAKLKPGLSALAREPGALTPTPQQQQLQGMLAHVPWAGSEHGGSQFAESQLNASLRQHGLEYNTPAGQRTTQQQITRSFGPPRHFDPEGATQLGVTPFGGNPPTQIGMKPFRATPPTQGSPLDLMEERPADGWPNLPNLTRTGIPVQRPATPSSTAGTRVLRKTGAALPLTAGIGIPLAIGGGLLATKPGIRANVRALSEGGSTKERDVAGELPAAALQQADAIHQALLSHGLDPSSVRMGIDAPPGSGKTTLARALAQQAGMKNYGLDWEPGNWWKSTVGLGRNVEKMPRAPRAGEVLEHYMLGRTYDPELFDAMVHIHRDPATLRKQLQQRGHGAYIGDLMDLDKSLGVADLGFGTLGGETIDLGNGIQMKLRPHEGWGNALDQQLATQGIDPTGLTRHQKLLSLHTGKRQEHGAGWTPYVKSPFSGAETAAIGASIPLGVMAAKALRRRPV